MSDQLEFVALTEDGDRHHVVVRRGNWFQIIATFADRQRADDYAVIENSFGDDLEAVVVPLDKVPAPSPIADRLMAIFNRLDSIRFELIAEIDGRIIRAMPAVSANETATIPDPADEPREPDPMPPAVVEPAPPKKVATPPSRSGLTAEEKSARARALAAAKATAKAAAKAAAPPLKIASPIKKTNGARAPIPAAAEPKKTKGVTGGWSTARDPELKRPYEPATPPPLPAGSAAQQLADMIKSDLPALMEKHPQGPSALDLADHYSVPVPRVRDAMQKLVRDRVVRLKVYPGTPTPHCVPVGFESLGTASRLSKDEDRVFQVLRERSSKAGDVEISRLELVRRSNTDKSSVEKAIRGLVEQGLIVVKSLAGGTEPGSYKIIATP